MNVHNLVSITGRLTADPELKTTQSGVNCCRFCVAVNRPYQKDKEQEADFINVVAWRATAEFVSKYFYKGTPITVLGSMRNNNYTDQNGVKHYSIDVLADNVGFVPKSSDSGNAAATSAPATTGYTFAEAPKSVSKPAEGNENVSLGDLSDFEEILQDGEVPF